ncbi:MAG TPA: alanine racemase [Candidatus Paceibacterota bacterium]
MNTRSWVEVDKQALKHNVGVFRRVAKLSKVMAVVKGNAYGHGMLECAKIFEQELAPRSSKSEVGWLGVDDIDEALALRKAGLKLPILVLGYTLPSRFPEAVKHDISVTISSIESLKHCLPKKIMRSNLKHLHIHLKLETGLNRQGITENELPELLDILTFLRMSECCMEGVYSHFAAAELATEAKYKKYCELQMDNFERMSGQVERAVGHKLIKHMADTAAAAWLSRSRYDLVRIGVGLYGLDPTSRVEQKILHKLKLKPALSWYSIIAQVKKVSKGEPVGYNLTKRVTKDSQIAIVPVGYWHGYPWSLSNKGEVLVHGKKCKVMGRVCMGMMMIDVTNVPSVKQGDVATLIGPKLSAEEVATKAGTINYELVTRINSLLPRCFI